MGYLKLVCQETKQCSCELFCLTAPGPEDDVAEYYQQQVEMLEGFNEMDALAEHGYIPRMTEVHTFHRPSPYSLKVVCS